MLASAVSSHHTVCQGNSYTTAQNNRVPRYAVLESETSDHYSHTLSVPAHPPNLLASQCSNHEEIEAPTMYAEPSQTQTLSKSFNGTRSKQLNIPVCFKKKHTLSSSLPEITILYYNYSNTTKFGT